MVLSLSNIAGRLAYDCRLDDNKMLLVHVYEPDDKL